MRSRAEWHGDSLALQVREFEELTVLVDHDTVARAEGVVRDDRHELRLTAALLLRRGAIHEQWIIAHHADL
ncbi:hypothetical protein D3C72_2539500 [compost metagenome]